MFLNFLIKDLFYFKLCVYGGKESVHMNTSDFLFVLRQTPSP